MRWMTFLALMFVHNAFAAPWNSSKVSCDSSLRCFLLTSKSAPLEKMQETDSWRKMNTWHPIPKWKVFLDANKNRNGYSSPYFNKQDSDRTDGDESFGNDFSRARHLTRRVEVFERLNIQFLPLEDGNITVKTFGGKINDSAAEYVALFVVYAQVKSKEILKPNNSDGSAATVELLGNEMANRKDNISISCDEADGCNENRTEMATEAIFESARKNETSSNFEVITIPVTKNMTIEMSIGEFDGNNYTVMIIPVDKNSTMKNVDQTISDGVIKILLTRNMSIVMESGEHSNYSEPYVNETVNGNVTTITELSTESEVTEDTKHFVKTEDKITESNEYLYNNYTSNIKNKHLFTTTDIPMYILTNSNESQSENGTNKNHYIEGLLNTEDNLGQNLYYTNTVTQEEIHYNKERLLNTEDNLSQNLYYTNTVTQEENETDNAKNLNDTKKENTTQLNNNVDIDVAEHINNTTVHRLNPNLFKFEYSKTFGPYEVKQLNSSSLPFIATFHITINNKNGGNSSDYETYILSKRINPLAVPQHNLHISSKDTGNDIRSTIQRSKRYVIKKGDLNEWQKSHNENELMKEGNTYNENISHSNEIGNKYLRRKPRMILNKPKETSVGRSTNYNSLILPRENVKEQRNSSKIFSFSDRHDSYSSSTISKNNEEFNQEKTGKLRNKGLIANEISDNTLGRNGVKCNQTTPGNRNKREVALLTLIPNKDSRENHSKKSELQIVEGGLVDKFSDVWRMKIPAVGQSLGESGIKTGKMCDLEDGCSGINGVFNTVKDTESKFHEDNEVVKEDFYSNESIGAQEDIDEIINAYNQTLKQGKSDETFIQTVIKRFENNLDAISDESSETATRDLLHFKQINTQSLENNFERKGISSDMKNKVLRFENDANIQSVFTSKENERPRVNEMQVLQNNANPGLDSNAFMNRFLRKRLSQEERKTSRRESRDVSKFNLNALHNNPLMSRILRRTKRSNIDIPFILNHADAIYLMNLNQSPTRLAKSPTRALPQFALKNYSLLFANVSSREGRQLQTIPFNLIPMNSMNARADSRIMDSVQPRPQNRIKEWLRRGSKWPENNKQATEINDPVLMSRMVPGYNWIIMIPQVIEPRSAIPVTLKPTRPPIVQQFAPEKMSTSPIFKSSEPGNISTPSEREREDDGGQTPAWELIKPTKRQRINKSNDTTFSPREMIPRKIVNTPRRKPNFGATPNPWFPDQRWELNQWSTSYNPWKNVGTTPMMMMRGMMVGGD